MAEQRVQRRLAAILAADVVGYTRLMEADETGTLARLKALRRDVRDPCLEAHQGRVFKTTGDGLLIEFASTVDAVEYSVEVQRAMAGQNDTVAEDQRIQLRIGINLGDVIFDEGDVFGDGVNVAARLEGIADAGGICISGAVFDQITNKTEFTFTDMGPQQVKNISAPVRTYRVELQAADTAEVLAPQSLTAVLNRPAIAVLPFVNMGGEPEQEYFADGLTEDIITALSAWRSFPVIARNSSFTYKGTSVKVQQVARELGVRYVVEGSVRMASDRMRITAQLIDAETGHHVWAEKYDRELEDLFDLQDEITQRIAAIIEPEIEKSERKRSTIRQPMNLDAWECYQRGMLFLYEYTREGNTQAREMFERAIGIDPSYAQAYTGLAYSHHRDLFIGAEISHDETLANFRQAVRRAVALDDTDSYAHWVLGLLYMWDENFDLAVAQGKKSIQLNPSNSVSYVQLGAALTYSGNPAEGISHIEKGIQLNPRDPRLGIFLTHLADACLNAERYQEAVAAAQAAILELPEDVEARLVRASALGHLERLDDARMELEACRKIDPHFADPSAGWQHFRTEENLEHLFQGLRKAGWTP